jgi:serine phosphatase RsbU (regulator of sigma subunit)
MLGRVSLPSEVRPLVTVAVVPPATQPAAPPGVSAAVPQPHTGTGPTSSVAGTATLREQVAGGRASGSGRVRDADGSARRGLAPAAAEPATRRPPGSAPEEDALAAATRRVDLLSQVTRLLLDEQSLSEPVTLHRVAWLLQADAAEWVIIDLVRGAGITRAVVAGPDLPPQPLVAGERAEPAPLHTQVLASGRAVLQPMIEDENALGLATTGSPVLTALGAGSVLCVPMRANGTTAGVLTMVRPPEQRPFSLSDLRIFEEIGEHLALALHNGRRYQRRSDSATALRASVLPRGPVQIPGLDWAAAYRVGTEGAEVGGDFYDLFRSPGGWGVVLGDVCGKGEEAAAVTAMVRHGIRLLSLWDAAPAQVLAKVNTAMLAQQETDRFVTAVAAHLSWQEEGLAVELASAGHPAAAVLRAGGTVSFSSGGGLPLGLFEDGGTRTERLLLQPGDALVLYSDGVTERHAADGALYGTIRLADVLTRSLGEPAAAAVVRAIEDDLNAFSQGAAYRDDVAILAVRVEGVPDEGPAAG